MLDINQKSLPVKYLISFDNLLKRYDAMAKGDDPLLAARAKDILEAQAPYPELRDGFTDISLLEKYKDVISVILKDSFAEVLGENEIKAATLPYDDVIINTSARFRKLLDRAGVWLSRAMELPRGWISARVGKASLTTDSARIEGQVRLHYGLYGSPEILLRRYPGLQQAVVLRYSRCQWGNAPLSDSV